MIRYALLCLLVFFSFSCKKSTDSSSTDFIPEVPVNLVINLALPAYFHLQNTGTFVFENGGAKGIVLVHHTDDNYYAFDRSCAYEPTVSGCSRIEVDTSFMQFRCGQSTKSGFLKCCDSRYFFDGSVAQTPTRYPLKSYRITKSGNIINIFN